MNEKQKNGKKNDGARLAEIEALITLKDFKETREIADEDYLWKILSQAAKGWRAALSDLAKMEAEWREALDSERALSDSYVRLRGILGALHSKPGESIIKLTEAKASELQARIADLEENLVLSQEERDAALAELQKTQDALREAGEFDNGSYGTYVRKERLEQARAEADRLRAALNKIELECEGEGEGSFYECWKIATDAQALNSPSAKAAHEHDYEPDGRCRLVNCQMAKPAPSPQACRCSTQWIGQPQHQSNCPLDAPPAPAKEPGTCPGKWSLVQADGKATITFRSHCGEAAAEARAEADALRAANTSLPPNPLVSYPPGSEYPFVKVPLGNWNAYKLRLENIQKLKALAPSAPVQAVGTPVVRDTIPARVPPTAAASAESAPPPEPEPFAGNTKEARVESQLRWPPAPKEPCRCRRYTMSGPIEWQNIEVVLIVHEPSCPEAK